MIYSYWVFTTYNDSKIWKSVYDQTNLFLFNKFLLTFYEFFVKSGRLHYIPEHNLDSNLAYVTR